MLPITVEQVLNAMEAKGWPHTEDAGIIRDYLSQRPALVKVDVEAVREVIAELRQASWDEQNSAHRFYGDQADKLAAAIGDK